MANFPPGEAYVTAPVGKTVEVPLAPVVQTHAGADKGLVPPPHAYPEGLSR